MIIVGNLLTIYDTNSLWKRLVVLANGLGTRSSLLWKDS